jgi:Protein of unknown function (DUF3618)
MIMSYSEQLERETENCRGQLADTLAELRERLTPGQVVDQLVDYAQDTTGGLFYHNLKRQVANNPMPVALLGAGLAWLMLANRKGGPTGPRVSQAANAARESLNETADAAADAWRDASTQSKEAGHRALDAVGSAASDAREGLRSGAGKVSEAASRVGETASEGVSRLRDKLAETTSRAKGAASAVGDTVSSSYERATLGASRAASAMADSASGAASGAMSSSRALFDFCREQPLVLAGIGVAVGAALGAMLPATEAEDRLMGETSDDLKETAQDFAGEQIEKAKAVGEHAYKAAGQEAQRQGLTGDAMAEEAASVGREAGIVPSEEQVQESGSEELETPNGRRR